MKQLAIIAGILALLLSPQLLAQDSILPKRIVIAPPLTPVAQALKIQLAIERDGQSKEAQDLYFFYGERGFEPLWITEGDGGWSASRRGELLLASLSDADTIGLDPQNYSVPLAEITMIEEAVVYELAVTSVALQFGLDNYGGRLDPRSISSNLDMPQPTLEIADLLRLIGEDDDPGRRLMELAPRDPEFQALLDMLANFEDSPEVVQIAEGPIIRPGSTDDRVSSLRERLGLPGRGGDTTYDDELVEAVTSFQLELGLAPDGIVGNATREALNRLANLSKEQILVNLEKWRWLPRERGEIWIEVNIPEYRLRVWRSGEVVYETRVVVGTPTNQTPVFYDQVQHVVVNPYWNVPASITRNEIGPQVLRDPGYLARGEYELLSGGTVVDPSSVDWSRVAPGTFPFVVRQKPGVQNALGQVKFLFPNKHAVYLHDTPEKSLFARDMRAYSHGCIRVENPFDFAGVLLSAEPAFGRDDLLAAFGPRERWFNMEVKVPVYLTYFTLRPGSDGEVRSFADIYGHDDSIAVALRGANL